MGDRATTVGRRLWWDKWLKTSIYRWIHPHGKLITRFLYLRGWSRPAAKGSDGVSRIVRTTRLFEPWDASRIIKEGREQ